MASQTWRVIDVAEHVNLPTLAIDRSHVDGAPEAFAISKRTWRGGLSDGVDEIRVNNGKFSFSVLPTRGMGIWKASLDEQWTLGWESPVRGPVHPTYVPLSEPSGLGWLDGFDELLCRCGAESNGAPEFDDQGRLAFPLHGRMANKPARDVEVSVVDDEISIKGIVLETRFHFVKFQLTTTIKTRFNQLGFEIHDELKNLSSSPAEMQMLYHTNFGVPLLSAGAEVIAPVDVIVPRNDWAADGIGHWSTYSEPKAGMPERVYFFTLHADNQGQTQVLLRSAQRTKGVSLHWNVEQLPCFTLWKNEASLSDGYVTGLEPGTNYPNPRSFEGERGRIVRLDAGQSHSMQLRLSAHADTGAVQDAEAAIAKIQADRKTTLHNSPQPEWCAP